MGKYGVFVGAFGHLLGALVVVLIVAGCGYTVCVRCMLVLFSCSCVTVLWHIYTPLRSIRLAPIRCLILLQGPDVNQKSRWPYA
jgi:hypothetical protein